MVNSIYIGKVVLYFTVVSSIRAYHDVVLIHGLNDNSGGMQTLADHICRQHSTTTIYNMNLFPDWSGLLTLPIQLRALKRVIHQLSADPNAASRCKHHNKSQNTCSIDIATSCIDFSSSLYNVSLRPLHIVGHSQGGLLARAVIQSWPLHPVRSLITLGAPHAGQFGIPSTVPLPWWLSRLSRFEAYRILYTDQTQSLLSIANYWLDPRHYNSFLRHSRLLAQFNNLLAKRSDRLRSAMLRLKRVVLVAGPDDDVIVPWQSGHFGFYTIGRQWRRVLSLQQRPTYIKDLIGLRTLQERGDLILHTFPGVRHQQWPRTTKVLQQAVIPYLD